jgi:hypothetical protein
MKKKSPLLSELTQSEIDKLISLEFADPDQNPYVLDDGALTAADVDNMLDEISDMEALPDERAPLVVTAASVIYVVPDGSQTGVTWKIDRKPTPEEYERIKQIMHPDGVLTMDSSPPHSAILPKKPETATVDVYMHRLLKGKIRCKFCQQILPKQSYYSKLGADGKKKYLGDCKRCCLIKAKARVQRKRAENESKNSGTKGGSE